MNLKCPECGEDVRVDDDSSAQTVQCTKCSFAIELPQATSVTTSSPRPRRPYADDDERRGERESLAPPTRRGNNWTLLVILFLVVGAPLLLLVSCIGLSVLVTLFTHDEMEVQPGVMAPMPPQDAVA